MSSTPALPRRGDVVADDADSRGTVTNVTTETTPRGTIPLIFVRRWSDGGMVVALPEHLRIVRRRRYSSAIDVLIDGWDGGDVWGSAMDMAWAVAEVARAAEVVATNDAERETLDAIPSILDVTWGAAAPLRLDDIAEQVGADDVDDLDVSYSTAILAAAYVAGDVTADDLHFAARVLSRYLDVVRAAGLDY